jgi:predicted DCC family thiol-disulfide oxidoreductase YuxK
LFQLERVCSQPVAGGGKKRGLQQHPVIFFDGVCNLCSGAVQWIIRRDPQGLFHFATLQSRNVQRLETIILRDGECEYHRSTAFLYILRRLPRYKWLAYFGAMLPEPIRDGIYDLVASNRYRWFGKKEQCMDPTPEIASRFIDRPMEA